MPIAVRPRPSMAPAAMIAPQSARIAWSLLSEANRSQAAGEDEQYPRNDHQQAAATAPRPRAAGSPRVGPATAAEQAPPRAASHAHGYFSLLLKTVSSDLVSPLLAPLAAVLPAAWQRLEQATQQALPGVADATSSRRPSPSGVGWEIEQAPDE